MAEKIWYIELRWRYCQREILDIIGKPLLLIQLLESTFRQAHQPIVTALHRDRGRLMHKHVSDCKSWVISCCAIASGLPQEQSHCLVQPSYDIEQHDQCAKVKSQCCCHQAAGMQPCKPMTNTIAETHTWSNGMGPPPPCSSPLPHQLPQRPPAHGC